MYVYLESSRRFETFFRLRASMLHTCILFWGGGEGRLQGLALGASGDV